MPGQTAQYKTQRHSPALTVQDSAQSNMKAPGAECVKVDFFSFVLTVFLTAAEGTTDPCGELRAQNNCLTQQFASALGNQPRIDGRWCSEMPMIDQPFAAYYQFLQIHSRLEDRSVFIRRGAEQCNKNLLV
jgi:hypothetical protein